MTVTANGTVVNCPADYGLAVTVTMPFIDGISAW